jgi:pimeloyl-ACP methyl ester carboxylesterase
MPSVRAGGLDIGYDVHGAGPPLVMLHGAGSSGREDWAAQIPAFSRAFHVFLPDARGHATTRWDAREGWSAEVLVDDLAAFVDALGLDTFHLAGFSMGGLTALRFASREPARVRTLLLGGVPVQRDPRASLVGRLMDPDRRPSTGPLSEEALARRHDAVQGTGAWRDLFRAIAADVQVQPLLTPRDLRRADMPALIAVGDRDPFVPVDQAWALSRQIGDGRLLVLPDAGHELMVRRPGLFNEAAAVFYRTTEPIARRRAERDSITGGEP